MSSGPSEALHAELFAYGEQVYDTVGFAEPVEVRHLTVKANVPRDRWVEALTIARDQLGLVYFSFLSAIDWTNEVRVGDPPAEKVKERIELIALVGDISEGRKVVFHTDLDAADPEVDSLVSVYPGANWHEREAYEMFGIEFVGHPDLRKLYLPEGFEGHPLRKSFPLLSREVRPWPGTVDVEPMPEASS